MSVATTVYENNDFFVVLHDRPTILGHMRIFPKQAYATIEEIPRELLGTMFETASKCATLLFDGLQCQGTNILVLNGKAAGQSSERVCIEVIPRFEKDDLGLSWQPKQGDIAVIEAVAKDIASKLIIPKEEKVIPPPPLEKADVSDQKKNPTEEKKAEPKREVTQPIDKKPDVVEFEPLPKNMLLYELLRLP